MCVYRTDEGVCKKFSVNGTLSYCVDGPCPDEVLTNADRIRSMSDEELADKLVIKVDGLEKFSVYLSAPIERMFFSKEYANCKTLEWLQKTTEEE